MWFLMLIGVIGATIYNHHDTSNAVALNISMILLAVGLIGTTLFRWMEQRAKSNGKRAVNIANTAHLVFIVILGIWTILGKLGIL